MFGDRVCRGCKRFHQEVVHWNLYSKEQKDAVWRRLDALLDRVVAAKLEVFDAALLRARLDLLAVRYRPEQPLGCLAYLLIARGARAVGSLGGCGVRLARPFAHLPLAELRDCIDREYFALSEAYQERYLAVSER